MPNRGAYFPLSFLTQFFEFLHRNSERVNVMTYRDFDWGDDFDWNGRYPQERKRWQQGVRSGRFDRRKAHLVIQYDVDSHEHRTMELLRQPEHKNIPANIMVFSRRVDRRVLSKEGQVQETPYELDHDLLEQCETEGHVIGYHTNAVERALFDLEEAKRIFAKDLAHLRNRYDVSFFSPHGGAVGPNGERNRSIELPSELAADVRWVHNGATPKFKEGFTDGGHNAQNPHPDERDLRDFVARFQPGRRYRVVLHPQYYDEECRTSENYSRAAWYREMMAADMSTTNFWPDSLLAF